MTEVEAYSLKVGDQIVFNNPTLNICREGVVEKVCPWDMSVEILLDQGYGLVEARQHAYDGPIIVIIDENGHRCSVRAPYIHRAKVDFKLTCLICGTEVILKVSPEQKWKLELYPIQEVIPGSPGRFCQQCIKSFSERKDSCGLQ